MKGTRNTQFIIATTLALAAGGAGFVGCSDDNADNVVATDYTYEDAYLYDSYYPADVAYAGYYWADAWDYSTFYYYLGYGGTAAPTRNGGHDRNGRHDWNGRHRRKWAVPPPTPTTPAVSGSSAPSRPSPAARRSVRAR